MAERRIFDKTVLFLCAGNSARSQIAEGLLKHFGPRHLRVLSAGTRPAKQVHPMAVKVLTDLGIDISKHEPKSCQRIAEPVDYVIALCEDDPEQCPGVTSATVRARWLLPDPNAFHSAPHQQKMFIRELVLSLSLRLHGFLKLVERPDWPMLPREKKDKLITDLNDQAWVTLRKQLEISAPMSSQKKRREVIGDPTLVAPMHERLHEHLNKLDERAVAREQEVDTLLTQADEAYAAGDEEKAGEFFNQALQLHPALTFVQNPEGPKLRLGTGSIDELFESFRRGPS